MMALPRRHHLASLSWRLRNLYVSPSSSAAFAFHPSNNSIPLQLQRRKYHIHLAHNNDSFNRSSTPLQPLSPEEIKRNNLISTRLYRILLRSCVRDVQSTNKTNKILIDGNIQNDWMLLQPPLDVRKYGHANILQVRNGELYSTMKDDDASNERVKFSSVNRALQYMIKEEVGRAMDVLRFVHISLGGNEDDDLEDYYLNASMDDGHAQEANAPSDFGKEDLNKALGAAAGRHSEGHYTQFLDDDEERGEGSPSKDGDEQDEYYPQHEQLEDEYINPPDLSVLVQTKDLVNAIRIAFRAPVMPSSDNQHESLQSIITRRHRDAIDASSLFSEQLQMWSNKSSVCVNNQHGVRIVATSSRLQLSPPLGGARMGGKKYKFAYRIRVENINDAEDNNTAVQLLGRTWNIYECRTTNASLLTKLLEEGSLPPGDSDEQEDIQVRTLVQNVHEPKTGAVGHFPVICPGEVCESYLMFIFCWACR